MTTWRAWIRAPAGAWRSRSISTSRSRTKRRPRSSPRAGQPLPAPFIGPRSTLRRAKSPLRGWGCCGRALARSRSPAAAFEPTPPTWPTSNCAPQMKERGCTAVHSLIIVDEDAISTLDSSSRPLLKRYLDAMDSAPSPKPLLLSGGFRCPSATREDGAASDELRAYLQATSDLDNDVRQAVGAVMPLAVYFPEPSTLISEGLVAAMPKRGAAAVWLPNASELLGFMKFAAEHAIRRANAVFKNAQALKKPSEREERSPERWLVDMFDAVRARLKFDSSLSVVTSCAPLQDAGVARSGVTSENILRHMSVSTHFTGLSSATKYNNAKIGQGALTQVSHCPVHTRTPAHPRTHAFTWPSRCVCAAAASVHVVALTPPLPPSTSSRPLPTPAVAARGVRGQAVGVAHGVAGGGGGCGQASRAGDGGGGRGRSTCGAGGGGGSGGGGVAEGGGAGGGCCGGE